MSASPSVKSKVCAFEPIRSRRLDFGITTAPCGTVIAAGAGDSLGH